jgi:hypothetical protein
VISAVDQTNNVLTDPNNKPLVAAMQVGLGSFFTGGPLGGILIYTGGQVVAAVVNSSPTAKAGANSVVQAVGTQAVGVFEQGGASQVQQDEKFGDPDPSAMVNVLSQVLGVAIPGVGKAGAALGDVAEDTGIVVQDTASSAASATKTAASEAGAVAAEGGAPIGGVYAESANNVATGTKLAAQLRAESASSPFSPDGTLTPDALAGADPIPNLGPGQLGNPAIPAGYGKYTTQTFQSPSGSYQVHFYENPTTGDVLYDTDYKVVFNAPPNVPFPKP